jgi:hypothetical protein
VGGGLTASTTFFRTYDVVSKLFDLNRLRHVVTPYASVETLSVSEPSASFIQMDQRDAIDSGTEVRLGVRQRASYSAAVFFDIQSVQSQCGVFSHPLLAQEPPAEGPDSATQSSHRIALPMLTPEHLDGQPLLLESAARGHTTPARDQNNSFKASWISRGSRALDT